jgi:hypothetical protein
MVGKVRAEVEKVQGKQCCRYGEKSYLDEPARRSDGGQRRFRATLPGKALRSIRIPCSCISLLFDLRIDAEDTGEIGWP